VRRLQGVPGAERSRERALVAPALPPVAVAARWV
jgi:hypothetical protein